MKSQRSSRSEWWNNYSRYLKSPEWRTLRRRLYKDRDGKCEDCGKKLKSHYHAHHETYVRMGHEDLRDLTLLCTQCHQRRHPDKKITRKKKPRIRKSSLLLLALLALFLLSILAF